MARMLRIVVLLIPLTLLAFGQQGQRELRVFAGAANMPPLKEAAKLYEEKYGVKVWLTFGGSGVVLSQMKLTRKGDVYVPGSDDFMELAVKEKVVDPKSVRIVCWLIPVINVPKGNPKNIQGVEDLARPGLRIAIGRPGSVCLGDVAVEILQKGGLYDSVKKNIVTEAKDCADLAGLLKLGTVDAIIGWDVFSYWYPDTPVEVIPFPGQLLRVRHIPAGVTVFASDKKEAQRFVTFLASGMGKLCYAKCGYSIKPPKVTAENEASRQKKRGD